VATAGSLTITRTLLHMDDNFKSLPLILRLRNIARDFLSSISFDIYMLMLVFMFLHITIPQPIVTLITPFARILMSNGSRNQAATAIIAPNTMRQTITLPNSTLSLRLFGISIISPIMAIAQRAFAFARHAHAVDRVVRLLRLRDSAVHRV